MTNRSQLVNPQGPYDSPGARNNLASGDDRPLNEIRETISDLIRILSLHRWAFFIPFCLVASAAFILSLYYPRTYSASTKFERRSDPILVDLPYPDGVGAASFDYFRSTMESDLIATENLAEAIDNLGLTKDLPRNPDGTFTESSLHKRNGIARSYASTIDASVDSPSKHADIVYLSYTGTNPSIGAKLLDEVKAAYIRRTRAWVSDFINKQRSYFEARLAEAEAERLRAKRSETQFYVENPLFNPQNPGAVSTKIDQLAMEQRDFEIRKRETEGELAELQQLAIKTIPDLKTHNMLANIGVAASDLTAIAFISPQALDLAAQINELEAEILTLRETRGMTDEHPEVKALLASRTIIQNQLHKRRLLDDKVVVNSDFKANTAGMALAKSYQNPRLREEQEKRELRLYTLRSRIKDFEISLETNRLQNKRFQEARENIYRNEDAFQVVSAEVDKTRKRYLDIAKTLARFTPAKKAVEQDRLFQFIEGESARGSTAPVNPKAGTIFLLAILAGLAAGTVFVILAEIMDHVYRSSADVARSLGLPILDGIDEIITAADRRRRLVTQTVVVPIIVIGFLAITSMAGTVAYVSIKRPWFLDKIKNAPKATWDAITTADDTSSTLASLVN